MGVGEGVDGGYVAHGMLLWFPDDHQLVLVLVRVNGVGELFYPRPRLSRSAFAARAIASFFVSSCANMILS